MKLDTEFATAINMTMNMAETVALLNMLDKAEDDVDCAHTAMRIMEDISKHHKVGEA
mgnify:CR=1 FL=1